MTELAERAAATGNANGIDLVDMRRRIGAIVVGSLGNLIEWYDFYAYTAFSLYFAGAFFPKSDPVIQQLDAAFFFWAGFIMRPVGGWLFGYLADHHGRRLSLMVSVLLMCAGSLMIAVTPTFADIGQAAPVVLAFARILQGLSLGGEYGASATYLTEIAEPKRRGFYSSFQYVTLIGGQLTAIVVLLLLQQIFLTPEQLTAWGWRIPFAIGALLALFGAVMRSKLPETEAFEEAKRLDVGHFTFAALFKYPREVALVVGLTAGGTAAFYTYTTYMQTYLRLSVGLDFNTTTLVTAATLIFAIILQPIYGAISDVIGRKWLLIGFGVAGVLFTVPLLSALQATKSAMTAFLLIAAAWVIVSGYTSINAVVKAELFPTKVRATGVALPYAVTVTVFGGTAPLLALWFKTQGHESWFYWYLTACIAASLLVYLTMRDTKTQSALDRHV